MARAAQLPVWPSARAAGAGGLLPSGYARLSFSRFSVSCCNICSATCVLKILMRTVYFNYMAVLRIIGFVFLLAGLFLAPAHNAMGENGSSSMMMTMDGSPCPSQDCGSMSDCTMALPGSFLLAWFMPDGSNLHRFHVSSVAFDFFDVTPVALFAGDGLRRPPKI